MRLKDMNLTMRFGLLLTALVVVFAAAGTLAYRTIQQIRIEGHYYNKIVQGKDLGADILPPPAYIIESYLTAVRLQTAKTPDEVAELEKYLADLGKVYEERVSYWETNLPEGPMQDMLARSAEPARQFYSLVANKLVPLVHEGKSAEAEALVETELWDAYSKHRGEIDRLVTAATELSKTTEDEAEAALHRGWISLGTVLGLSLAALAGMCILMARSITVPLSKLESSINKVAEGDLTVQLDADRKDELGRVSGCFNTFAKKIERMVMEVQSGTHEIDAGATQISTASQSLAEGASEQAASLQQISASVEEMASMTQHNADNSKQANSMAESAKHSADKGQSEMREMSQAMGQIKESSSEIAKIIKVIDEIAFQTNLLALNAAVEAARAGEAGKGFAVVAEEVRSLAQRSAEAAKSTSSMIEEAARRADHGVDIAGRVGQSLDEIASTATKVNTLLAEIASASSEQAKGISQVNTGISQLDKVTQQNAGNSEELASGAEETASQVTSLQELVRWFKTSASSQDDNAQADARVRASMSTQKRKAATPAGLASRPPVRSGLTPGGSKRAFQAAASSAGSASNGSRQIPMTLEEDAALESF